MITAILLLLAADITGHVTGGDAKTEVRVIRGNGVEVQATKLDAKGGFVFHDAGPGHTIVEALAWQGKSLSYAWTEWKGQPVELKLVAVKPLIGRVVTVSGRPLPRGLEVSLPGEITTKVAADGSFSLGVLPPDEYEVEVEHLRTGASFQLKMGAVAVNGTEIDLRRTSGPLTIIISLP